jgi:hypothetical protein
LESSMAPPSESESSRSMTRGAIREGSVEVLDLASVS